MISGSPPTERKARTGLFTPPTSTFSAFAKISRERRRSGFTCGCVALISSPARSGQPASSIFGVVGQDNLRPGSLNPRQNFQHNSFFFDPLILRRGFHHRIFAADIVRRDRHIKAIAYRTNNVQIGKRRLHHHHIRAFLQIQLHFLHRFTRICGIHLVAAPIAKLRRGFRGFPERPIEAGTVFGSVGNNGNIFKFMFIEFRPYGADPAVHHVRGGDHISAGPRVGKCLFRQNLQGGVIRYFSVLNHTAMTVVGIFAQADVCNDQQLELRLANPLNGCLHHAVGWEGTSTAWILFFWQPEQNDAGDAKRFHLLALFHQLVDGLLVNPRHGADFLMHLCSRAYEEGVNEPSGAEAGLSHESAQSLRTAQTPGTIARKTHSGFTPAGKPCCGFRKYSASAPRVAATVVSRDTMIRLTPASRSALSVTGPIAVNAVSSDKATNRLRPKRSKRRCTDDGLKKSTACAPSRNSGS